MKRDEGGQVITLVAIALPVFLAILLLAIDGGRVLLAHERLRNAAQLAAEAGASLAGDGAAPSTAAVKAVVDETLRRNLGTPFVSTVTTPAQATNPAFNVKVAVTQPFVASVQRISFPIGAEAAAQLGQPGAKTEGAAQMAAARYVSGCFIATLEVTVGDGGGSVYHQFSVTNPANNHSGQSVRVRPGTAVPWRVELTRSDTYRVGAGFRRQQRTEYSYGAVSGELALPAGQVAGAWRSVPVQSVQVGRLVTVTGVGTWAADAGCPA